MHARDHVLITFFLPLALSTSIFFETRGSMYGHFLRLRVIIREIKV